MKTSPQKPNGLTPFDLERHLPIINAFITTNETALYNVNSLLGSTLRKADGVRMSFDIVHIHYLLNPTRDKLVLSYGPTFPGMADSPLATSREIAGVVDNELWFSMGGEYFSAQSELEARMEMLKTISDPLKAMLDEIKDLLEERIKDDDDDGEDWKD